MLRILIAFVVTFAAFWNPALASTQVHSGNVFEIDANIFAADDLIGQPKLLLVAGSETALAVDGRRGYGLRLTVDNDLSKPESGNAIIIRAKLYFNNGGHWVLVSAPEIRTVTGAVSRQSSSNTTVYGNGGFTLDIRVARTEKTLSPEEFASVEDCPVWKELAVDGPLPGVRVRGQRVRSQLGDSDLAHCSTSGHMRCCT